MSLKSQAREAAELQERMAREAAELQERMEREAAEEEERRRVVEQEAAAARRLTATTRIQRAVKAYARNWLLRKRVRGMFSACEQGDLHTLRQVLTSFPDYKPILNKFDSFCTLVNAAVRGGNADILHYLSIKLVDLTTNNVQRNTVFHTAAAKPTVETFSILAQAMDASVAEQEDDSLVLGRKSVRITRGLLKTNSHLHKQAAFEMISQTAGSGSRPMQGWLSKRKVRTVSHSSLSSLLFHFMLFNCSWESPEYILKPIFWF